MLILRKKTLKTNGYLEKYLNSILIIVMVVLPFLYYFLFFQKTYKDISSTKKEAKQLAVDINDLSGRLTTVENYNQKISKISAIDLKKIEEALPSKIDIPSLFVNFEALGLSNNLKLVALSVQEDTSKKARTNFQPSVAAKDGEVAQTADQTESEAAVSVIRKAIITVSYKGGGYVNLKNLVESLENNLRLLRIDHLSFNPKDGSMNLVLEAYYLGI